MNTAHISNCRLCGGSETTVLFEAQGYPIVHCQTCGVSFTGHAMEQHAVEGYYSNQYFKTAAEYAESLKQASTTCNEDDEERVRVASRLAQQCHGRVLDVGCAAGGLLAAFKRAGWQCCGIEPSAELAAHTRRLVGCDVHQAVLEKAGLPAASFDVVTALHVLEHAVDPRSFLQICHRLLKPGGIVLIEVPDFGSRFARRQREAWPPLYPDTHLYHFTIDSLSRLLVEGGFHVARVRRYGGLGILDVTGPQPRAGPQTAAVAAAPAILGKLKRHVFEARHLLYRVPWARQAVRFAYWHLLRMNLYLQVFAVKISPRST